MDEAQIRLQKFDDKRDADYSTIVKFWRSNWPRITPFFDYPAEIPRIIYTTNAIESVNMSLLNITKTWTMPLRDWKAALTRFTIQFEERMLKT